MSLGVLSGCYVPTRPLPAAGLIRVTGGGRFTERRPIVATARKPCKALDLEAMSNREVLAELSRIYGDLVSRLSMYAEVLDAKHELEEGPSRDVPDDQFDAVYDQALGLISRIDELENAFMNGADGLLSGRDNERWNWGIHTFEMKLKQRASAGLASAGTGGRDAD